MRENRKHITRVSSDEARRLRGETESARMNSMTDDEIAEPVTLMGSAPPSTSTGISQHRHPPQGQRHAEAGPRPAGLPPRPGKGSRPSSTGPAGIVQAGSNGPCYPEAKLAAEHKVELSAEERREAASWKKVYAAAAKRKAKKAVASPPRQSKARVTAHEVEPEAM